MGEFLVCLLFYVITIKCNNKELYCPLVIVKLDVKNRKYLYFFFLSILYFVISGSNVGSLLVFAVGSAMCDLTDSKF